MPADPDAFDCANQAKASFEEFYNAPDPRAYYRALGALDYRVPTEAKPLFRKVAEAISADRPRILDIGCSYGVNAAMLRYDLTFDDLVARYAAPRMDDLSSAEMIRADLEEFSRREAALDADFVGLDVAGEAAGYAKAVGLLDEAVIEDLEANPLSPAGARAVRGADLVITTGAVGYVAERTFSRVLDAAAGVPWVAAFVLRQFPFDAIAAELEQFGMETRRLEGRTFVQRAFKDDEEREGAIEAVRAAGRDPGGLETSGRYFAEFYLTAPKVAAGDARAVLEGVG